MIALCRQAYGRLRGIVLLRPVAVAIILIGLGAGILGFIYWYGPTFARYPVWQWAFVPDCPLFAILFAISLTLILFKRSVPLYDALVAFGAIKYGTWTVFLWVVYWINTGGDFSLESVTMALSHVGLFLEGLFLLSLLSTSLRMNWPTVAICALWFGLSDWMDYGPFQTYPHFPTNIVPLGLVQWQTIGVTIWMTAWYAYMAAKPKTTALSVASAPSPRPRGPSPLTRKCHSFWLSRSSALSPRPRGPSPLTRKRHSFWLSRSSALSPRPRGPSSLTRKRHSFWLWVFVLWVLGLGMISGWRGLVLWQARALLAELDSALPPAALWLFVLLFALCGLGLFVSALGLWQRRKWGRQLARACILTYFLIAQPYTWLFVRSGLMWERRWVSLVLAVLAVGVGAGALTWRTSRTWLGIG